MRFPMPATIEERYAVEVQAIEIALRHIRDRWVEKQILAALNDPAKDPIDVARWAIGKFCYSGPGEPEVDSYSKPGYLVARTWPDREEIVRIPMARVVEYVRRKHSPQLSLF